MKLTLAIPGLTWLDAYDGAEVTHALETPALNRLLARARLSAAPRPLSSLLGQPFGLSELNVARMAALGAGLDGTRGAWLVADPVHLRLERDRALLADVGVMRLSAEEASALTADLNLHFADDGLRFHAPSPGRWFLELAQAPAARFSPLPDVIGDNVNDHRPQGRAGLEWGRLQNEMQMLLFAHPVNQAREARNETPVNSLWLWGGGESATLVRGAGDLYSDDGVHHILARACDQSCLPAPYTLAALLEVFSERTSGANSVWVQLDRLQAAAQYRDAWGWREALLALETDWFAPLLAALKQGRIQSLTLVAHGSAGFSAELGRPDLWKFWRRARALPSLYR